MTDTISAACLIIGDEILSGRTKEANAGHLAECLHEIGIDLKEIRVVSDDEDAIVDAVQQLSKRYNYVFTSGGIGPTHDDITADSIAKAFERSIDIDPRAVAIMEPAYKAKGRPFSDSQKRMARIPEGAELIENSVSAAPGFIVKNVHVMAGVPIIFRAMLDALLPTLVTGAKVHSIAIPTDKPEGAFAAALSALQSEFEAVSMGSYPHYEGEGKYKVELVLKSTDKTQLAEAETKVRAMLEQV